MTDPSLPFLARSTTISAEVMHVLYSADTKVLALSLGPSDQARRTARISSITGAAASDQGSVSTARHRAPCARSNRRLIEAAVRSAG